MLLHALFDLLSLLCGYLLNTWFRRRHSLERPAGITDPSQYHYYLIALLLGLVGGSVLFGSLNLWLSGQTGLAKSMLGGVFGAIVAAEGFKFFAGIRHSTGLYFVPGLIALIVVGRIGCFLGGLADFTYGVPTTLPWGVDFGDGVARHPVQLYESATMLLFLIGLLWHYPRQPQFWLRQGFYLFVLVYAAQRFAWEFLKPYAAVFGSLNLFHLLSLGLILYALLMLKRSAHHAA